MSDAVWIINGPNINMMGYRDARQYGEMKYELVRSVTAVGDDLGFSIQWHQSNHEGVMIEIIHSCLQENIAGLIINPGGYTHTSIAIRDALEMVCVPKIEVHLSHIGQRESFRQHSETAAACDGQILGFRHHSYMMALYHIALLGKSI